MLKTRGKTLTAAQISAATDTAIDACDTQDGVKDGVLGDPRKCKWSARSAICGAPGAPRENCLDADQAEAYDVIRRGPRNSKGELIWFPFEPDTTVSTNTNYFESDGMMRWAVGDLTFSSNDHLYMDKAHLDAARDSLGITYEDMATLSSQRASDLVDGSNPAAMGWARASGTKVLMWTGTADRNIQPRNTIEFFRRTAQYLGKSVSDPELQSWYRVFLYPGIAHCGGGDGPFPGHSDTGPLFDALVSWVEKGVAPEQIRATKYADASRTPRPPGTGTSVAVVATRPVCPYPRTAVYKGSGSTDDAANFSCGGNLEVPGVIDQLAKFKFENGTGVIPRPYGPWPEQK
jgi:feruloyl esterase